MQIKTKTDSETRWQAGAYIRVPAPVAEELRASAKANRRSTNAEGLIAIEIYLAREQAAGR